MFNLKDHRFSLLQSTIEEEDDHCHSEENELPEYPCVDCALRRQKRYFKFLRGEKALLGFARFLLFIVLVLAVCLWIESEGGFKIVFTGGDEKKVLGSELVPDFPNDIRQFKKDVTFSERPSNRSNPLWENLFPKGRGYINVKNPHKHFDEHPGQPNNRTDGSQSFVLSVFHQLHCINHIRHSYFQIYRQLYNESNFANVPLLFTDDDSDDSPDTSLFPPPPTPPPPPPPSKENNAKRQPALPILHHITADEISMFYTQHCIDYLRQSVMCSADTTLEWARIDEEDNKIRKGADGWGVKHVCRNFDAVKEWTEKRRGDDRVYTYNAPT